MYLATHVYVGPLLAVLALWNPRREQLCVRARLIPAALSIVETHRHILGRGNKNLPETWNVIEFRGNFPIRPATPGILDCYSPQHPWQPGPSQSSAITSCCHGSQIRTKRVITDRTG